MRWDNEEFKECLNTFLNPIEIAKFNFDFCDNLAEYFIAFTMTIIMIMLGWLLLPLTLLISMGMAIKC